MNKLIIHEDGVDHRYECANGFVQRCVSAVHGENYADARKLARVLNQYYAGFGSAASPLDMHK